MTEVGPLAPDQEARSDAVRNASIALTGNGTQNAKFDEIIELAEYIINGDSYTVRLHQERQESVKDDLHGLIEHIAFIEDQRKEAGQKHPGDDAGDPVAPALDNFFAGLSEAVSGMGGVPIDMSDPAVAHETLSSIFGEDTPQGNPRR